MSALMGAQSTANAGPNDGMVNTFVDASSSNHVYLSIATPGVDFVSESGYRYLQPVPEPSRLVLWLAGLALPGAASARSRCARRQAVRDGRPQGIATARLPGSVDMVDELAPSRSDELQLKVLFRDGATTEMRHPGATTPRIR